MKRICTGTRDLRVVSQNQVISEPSKGVRTRSSFKIESNMALIFKIHPKYIDEVLQDQS